MVSGLPQGVRYVPAMMFQLTGWVYCFASRSHISDGDKLPRHLLDTYRGCLSWYGSALQSMRDQHGAGPFVQYAILSYPQAEYLAKSPGEPVTGVADTCGSLFYHFCLLTLFRPFCHLGRLDSDLSPVDICAESAESILALARSCNELGERHLPCFVPLFVYAAGLTEADIEAGRAVVGEAEQGPAGQGSSAGRSSSGKGSDASRSLSERAREQLLALGNVYPSARKCLLELRDGPSPQRDRLERS